MLSLDGAQGEGGGQILRTALALSMCRGRPFHIHHIRARRRRPGLQPQHLACVRAAATLCNAEVEGAQRDSLELRFTPGPVRAGRYHFAIGTAGSTSLLLQTLLPPLLQAAAPSQLTLEGGTHNPLAPTYDFLAQAYLPLINRMGPGIESRLHRPGFAPEGGGCIEVHVEPVPTLAPLDLPERGRVQRLEALVRLAHLPAHIAERELAVLARALSLPPAARRWQRHDDAAGAGNAIALTVESELVSEVFTALGRRGVPAEQVAGEVVAAAQEYLRHEVAVGRHLADQLLLPLALAGAGRFTTLSPSAHTRTNLAVIDRFLALPRELRPLDAGRWEVRLGNG